MSPDVIFYFTFICVTCNVPRVYEKAIFSGNLLAEGWQAAASFPRPASWFFEYLQVPRTSELYVHRSGRTARAASEGLSLLLIGPDDLINFRKIYKTLEKSEELPFFPVETKYMISIKVKKQSLCSLSICLLGYFTALPIMFFLHFRWNLLLRTCIWKWS